MGDTWWGTHGGEHGVGMGSMRWGIWDRGHMVGMGDMGWEWGTLLPTLQVCSSALG